MSVSELFDHGSAHPWADLRMNNLTVDGNLTVSGSSIFNGELLSLVVSMSGPIPPTNFTFLFSKIGRNVTLNIPDIQSNAVGGVAGNAISSALGTIGPDFLPEFGVGENEYLWPIRVWDNSVVQSSPGLFRIESNGRIAVFLTQQGAGFGVVGDRGSFSSTISYRSAI
jgi:hypothetical protein